MNFANIKTEIAKHFDGDSALVGGEAATEKGRQLAAEIGLEDAPVVTGETKLATTEHKEVSA
jgi:hypothetical protein